MKQLITLLLILFIGNFCKGQSVPADTAFISNIKNEGSMLSKTVFYFDSSSSLPVSEAFKKPFSKFKKTSERIKIKPALVSSKLYLKLTLSNNTAKEITGYIIPGVYFTCYNLYETDQQIVKINGTDSTSIYRDITLAAGKTVNLLLEIKPLKTEFGNINPTLVYEDNFDQYKFTLIKYKSDVQMYGLILCGVLLMMILFMLANFVTSRKTEFLYNAAYSFCLFLLVMFNAMLAKHSAPFINLYYSYFDFFLLVAGTIFYISFTRRFLETKNNYALLDRILKYAQRTILILLGVFTILNFFTNTFLPQHYLESIMKILFLALGFAFIYLALKRKDRLFNYIAAGNSMLVLFSLISFSLLMLNIKPNSIFQHSLFYYNTGVALELAFFLLGLTYKNKNELINEIKKQEALKLEAEKKDFETQLTVIKAQQEERNRISADMHDDLGAGMTTISLYSELAKSKLANNPIPEIEKISASANDLLNKMNAIIWSMTSSNDSLSNMIAYIRSYAQEYFEDTPIHCKIDIPEKLPNIEVVGEIRRNVFLVVKEALNNIMKHSKATEVSITLVRVEDGLTLYIHDNGTGINMERLRQFGNGLKNMRKRAADIKVDFSIENKEGTLITMHRKIDEFLSTP